MAGPFCVWTEGRTRGNLKLRVRVNAYTNIHAIAETQDGQLHARRSL